MNHRRRVMFTVCAIVSMTWASASSAQDVGGAARAYSGAQAAELDGDHARAAELYELAHSLAPAPAAMRAVVRTLVAADLQATAATQAERLAELYDDDDSQTLARETLAALRPALLRVEVTCEPGCLLSLDGLAVGTDKREVHAVYARPGRHELTGSFDAGVRGTGTVEGGAGERRSVQLRPAPGQLERDAASGDVSNGDGAERSEDSGGITPLVFVSSAVLTVGLGAATVWSGMDTLELRDEYDAMMTRELYDQGLRRELRTNILLGTTAAFAVTTVVLAFVTDWGGDELSPERNLSLSVDRDRIGAVWQGSF